MFRLSALFIGLFLALNVWSQVPEKFFYQAVARDAGGNLIVDDNISLRFSIIPTNPLNTPVYQELHATTTTGQGLCNLEVGTGLVTIGTFSAIDWSLGTYFLQVEMDPAGGLTFVDMGTTQLISVPYALYAETAGNVDDADADPSNELQSLSLAGNDLTISGGNTVTLPGGGGGGGSLDDAYDNGGAGAGRVIQASAGPVEINSIPANNSGLEVTNTALNSVSIAAENTHAGNTFSCIQSITSANNIQASSILGHSDGQAWGVTGQTSATSNSESAVLGNNFRSNGGHGVLGYGFNGTVGQTNYRAGYGVYGENYDLIGPLSSLAVGTAGKGYYGVLGEDRYLGGVSGAYGVFSNGDLGASGLKLFQIDLPSDPENYYLRHFCVESNEVLNVYRGNVVLDQDGEAIVELPDYFTEVNTNFSYYLTPIGAPGNLYVKQKVEGNTFIVAGGQPGGEVSWILYAERNDPYLQTYPEKKENVVEKSERERGKLQIPALYNAPDEKAMFSSPTNPEQPNVNVQQDKQ
ncbi:MAG: hypothetical protein KDC12_08825 [Flavobacteriales bacterium]|nr:hypothetical protein [Flavobacteriales bacterium]